MGARFIFEMRCLNCTFDSPEANLAADEALLDAAEAGESGEVLRFWESPDYFVTLGYTNKIASEVDEAACRARDIPILRRVSGGGTVLQGPGSFNYAVILDSESRPELQSVTGANTSIMARQRDTLSALLDSSVEVSGHTDLALRGRKFSGNAQRRKRRFLLFHGTLLLDFDLDLLPAVLYLPPIRPQYRADRAHIEFVTNIGLERNALKAALQSAWNATDSTVEIPHERIEGLIEERYGNSDWTRKF